MSYSGRWVARVGSRRNEGKGARASITLWPHVEKGKRAGAGVARGLGSSLPAEDVLGVAGPDLVLALVGAASKGAGASGAARHHVEARLGQLIEGLL